MNSLLDNTQEYGFFRKILNDWYFRASVLCAFAIALIHVTQLFSWYTTIIATLCSLLLMMIFFNFVIPNHKLGLSKFILSILFTFGIASYFIWNTIYDVYNKAEKIDEVIPLKTAITFYHNDTDKSFILVVDGKEQPLILRFNDAETYASLKNDFVNHKISVERKRVKYWYDEAPTEGYYLGDWEFTE